jgi:hypothetical protein
MLAGAVLIGCGYFSLTIEDFFLAYSFYYVSADYVGTGICTIGLILLMLGRSGHTILLGH